MNTSELWHQASDGKKLFVRRFAPEGTPRAVVHIAHGLGEHSARYARLASALVDQGYVVYANDHRGHGKTALNAEELGFFDGGVERVAVDLSELIDFERAQHPGLPVVLLGHSMGSYFAQELALRRGKDLAALVLSASAGKPNALATVGRYIARLERRRVGPRGKSALLRALTFDAFNKPFVKSGPTKFEWLSRDRVEVEKYVNDSFCGFEATTSLWVELLDLLASIANPARQATLPKSLPVYVVAGSEDPANDRTRGLTQLLAAYAAAGLTDVTRRFYPGARHEVFNETNREEVTADLLAWLDARLPRR